MADQVVDLQARRESFEARLQKQINFQRRWQTMSMSIYFLTTSATLFCTAGATLVAAEGLNELAAYLSGTAVFMVGTEKSLLFRERWKFHLRIYTQLLILSNDLDTGKIDLNKASELYGEVLKSYAETLPVEGRSAA
jgi:hypothetical protein